MSIEFSSDLLGCRSVRVHRARSCAVSNMRLFQERVVGFISLALGVFFAASSQFFLLTIPNLEDP